MVLFTSFQAVSSQPKKKIFMGALALSYNGDEQGFQAAMEYATETVNNHSDILKDYELVVRYAETLGSPIYTVFGVFNFLRWPKNESMQILIGPAWSKNAGPAALACGAYRVVQISYGATSVALQKDQYYGKLFSNVPSTTSFNFARIAVIKHFGWKRVAILQEYDDQLYSSAVNDFQDLLGYFARDVSIITLEGYKKSSQEGVHPKAELERLQKVDARIIIGEFSIYRAAEIFCEAYRLGMYGPKYVWFLSATSTGAWIFSPETFKVQHKTLRCSYDEVVTAADGFITIANVDIRQDNKTTVSGLNASTYLTELRKRNGQALARTSYAFDSIWAAALMLDKTSNETRPENFVLGSDKFSNEYEKLLKEEEFEGLSVRLLFCYFVKEVLILKFFHHFVYGKVSNAWSQFWLKCSPEYQF